MFKKFVALFILCLSVQAVNAKSLSQEYKEDEYTVSINYEILDKNKDTRENLYKTITTKSGAWAISQSIKKGWPKNAVGVQFWVPNKAIYVSAMDTKTNSAIIISNISKSMEISVVTISANRGMLPDPQEILASSVAQKAFKKAGFTLTRKDIENLVEVK